MSDLFFTGAPLCQSLDWQNTELVSEFNEAFSRFLKTPIHHEQTIVLSNADHNVNWRSLPLKRQHLATGVSQDRGWRPAFLGHDADFFTQDTVSDSQIPPLSLTQASPPTESFKQESQSRDEILSQYYEESYAVFEDIASSQLSIDESSFPPSDSSWGTELGTPKVVPIAGYVTNLETIPSARYLESIAPQTMSVNLILGIISLPAARSIRTRRGATVSLVEMVVGDETRSGFAINFWLPDHAVASDLRDMLERLRVQDVVLIRNVALSSFRGRVYGQSLRKEMTKCWLLYRNRLDREDVGGCYRAGDLLGEGGGAQIQKTKRVREWVLRFVGGPVSDLREGERGEVFPVETQ